MAAVLKIQADFETGPAVSAKGSLSLTSDRSKDPLNVTCDVRRANATSPVVIQQLEAKIGSLSVSATGSVNIQTTPSPLQIHAKTASAPIADREFTATCCRMTMLARPMRGKRPRRPSNRFL